MGHLFQKKRPVELTFAEIVGQFMIELAARSNSKRRRLAS
jgi:hypothetical protein